MTSSALAVSGLAKAFGGFRAVDGVSFEVAAGEMVALIGPNGAGKTTTFNIINGQVAADCGRVLLDGRDVTGLSPARLWRAGIGRTFQVSATFASMTAVENVAVALMSLDGRLARLSGGLQRHRAAAADLLEAVGLAQAAGRLASTLAYGDLKRLELAMALASRPRLLLMDEPTAGMATAERQLLMRLATRLAGERGMSVLFTEHDMDVVFGHAHRVLVMNRGRIIADGSPEAIRRNSLVREVYLGTE